ncbi:MAG: class I tRNA ligase family protein, partial [Nanoarchaeota archaeon]
MVLLGALMRGIAVGMIKNGIATLTGHIQIHHTNEIAQSESAFGKKPWVKYWLHSGHLRLKEGKMSKSAGSIIRLKDLEKRGFTPMDLRYLCVSTHYRKPLIFSFEVLHSSKN